MNNSIVEPVVSTIKTCANAISETTNAIAKIDEIKRTTGISKRQSNRLILEAKTNERLAQSFAKMCEDYPGLYYEVQIGNMKVTNIGQILSLAEKEFNQDETIPKIEIDNEWMFKFLDMAGEVSDLEKQTILAKVLAGQMKKPDSISYRTLRILKDLSQKDVKVFRKAISCSFHYRNLLMLIPRNNGANNYISVAEIMLLNECGLMDSSSTKSYNINKEIKLTSCSNQFLLIISSKNETKVSIDCHYFTDSALELLPFMTVEEANLDIMKEYATICCGSNKNVSLHNLIEKTEEVYHYAKVSLLD